MLICAKDLANLHFSCEQEKVESFVNMAKAENLCCSTQALDVFSSFLQTVRASGKMRFNKSEVTALALGQPSHKFEKEGVLFVREKQEGFFRRAESKLFTSLS